MANNEITNEEVKLIEQIIWKLKAENVKTYEDCKKVLKRTVSPKACLNIFKDFKEEILKKL